MGMDTNEQKSLLCRSSSNPSIQSKTLEQMHDGVIVVVGWNVVSCFVLIMTPIHPFGIVVSSILKPSQLDMHKSGSWCLLFTGEMVHKP
jgi:hypothetical protein